MYVPMVSSLVAASTSLCLWLGVAIAKSDCQCKTGFDPNVMPKMNVTDFSAVAYSNGSSV